jgi:TM2 domain-containing membrane protein YozV
MDSLNLLEAEFVRLKIQAQYIKGYPQTVGDLHLTNRRLILTPNQVLSIGFGKKWEILLSEIKNVETKNPFQGGSFVGSAGNRLVINSKDGTKHVFSMLGDIIPLFNALSEDINNQDHPMEAISSATTENISLDTDKQANAKVTPVVILQPGIISPSNPPKEPVLAVLLSLFFAGGGGQIYLGQVKKGVLIIILSLALSCIGIGFIFWFLGVVDSYIIANKLKSGISVGEMQIF